MIHNPNIFTKNPLPIKIYSAKEFIRDVYPEFRGDKTELSKDVAEEEETGEDEENYDLYFPGYDTF
jgi:hypothetical protein